MFRGTILSRHERWTNTMIVFTGDSFLAAQRLKDFPAFLRPVVKLFIPEVTMTFAQFQLPDSLISPVLFEWSADPNEKRVDLIQWMLDNKEYQTLKHCHISICTSYLRLSTLVLL